MKLNLRQAIWAFALAITLTIFGAPNFAGAFQSEQGMANGRGHDKEPQVKRYYDKKNKDTHEWNDNEDKAYRAYLSENHQEYRDFSKRKAPEQQQYFDWRHEHPDSTLFKVEIR